MKSLVELPNIGKVVAEELESVGIKTHDDLKSIGAAKAIYLIRGNSAKGCINMLYALEGAIQGIRWHNLSKEDKERVKKELMDLIE